MNSQNNVKSSRFASEQGDVNTTQNREKYWEKNLSETAKSICTRDNKYFLHQNLSTPVMNVLSKAHGIYIEDIDGKNILACTAMVSITLDLTTRKLSRR